MKIIYLTLFISLAAIFCNTVNVSAQTLPVIEELPGNWRFRMASRPDTMIVSVDKAWRQAKVPGTVHTDLFRNKLIPDPYYKDNERRLQWVEACDWEYQSTFEVTDKAFSMDQIDIEFEGVDTYAKVFLNDSLILTANNMFVGYKVPVKKYLKRGKNVLTVYFPSPLLEGLARLKANKYSVPAHNELAPSLQRSSVFLRKAPYHYGWDWGPRFVTAGLWQPVKVKHWNKVHINDLFVQQKSLTKEKAELMCELEVSSTQEQEVQLAILIADKPAGNKVFSLKAGLNKIQLPVSISSPKLWWPHGLGQPFLYHVKANLTVRGQVYATLSQQVGVRTIEWVQQSDTIGKSFYAKVNGVPVFMKGANYIPADNFITEVGNERYKKVIQAAADANMNMLRVWGGGVYETNEFYNLCDQNGILIWQDFMFACSMIPPGAAHQQNLEDEFTYSVKRLRNHPCMAIYCGNNENMVGWFNWNWKTQYQYSSKDSTEIIETYKKVTHEMMPAVINKYDSSKFFWPSSPSSGPNYNDLPNSKSGDLHDWQVWFANKPYDDYERTAGRFVSEYGMQSFPEMRTIRSFSDSTDWQYRSPLFEFKQRSQLPWVAPGMNGNGMIAEYLKRYYRWPVNFEKFVYVSQLSQALCFKTAVETHRRKMPYCMGSLYWQLDDCWPTVSWSSMDYYYRWKASHYAIKKSYEPVIIVIDTTPDALQVFVVSDNLKPTKALLRLQIQDFKGKVVWSNDRTVEVKANGSQIYYSTSQKDLLSKINRQDVVLIATLVEAGKEMAGNLFYFAAPKDLNLLPSQAKTVVQKTAAGYEVRLSSTVLLKNIYLQSEVEGFFSDNYFDLLPGQTTTVKFRPAKAGTTLKAISTLSLVDTY